MELNFGASEVFAYVTEKLDRDEIPEVEKRFKFLPNVWSTSS